MARPPTLALPLVALVLALPRAAGAGPDLAKAFEALKAAEAKALLPVLRGAVKGDHRRQAWWAATRLLAVAPSNEEAAAALRAWKGEALQEGEAPSKAFLAQRDAALRKVGAEYAAAARSLQAAGAAPAQTFSVVERALACGNRDADVVASLEEAGQAWCGTWGPVAKEVLESTLGRAAPSVVFLPEHDDAALRVRVAWPAAGAARVGSLVVATGGPPAEAFPRFALVAAVEAHLLAAYGTAAKEERDPERAAERRTTLVALPDVATFDAVVPLVVRPPAPDDEPVTSASRWTDPWRRVTFVVRGHRDHAWLEPDALLAGAAAHALVRHHLVAPHGGRATDPGTWALVEGVAGTYEGFVVKAPGEGELDVARMWRIGVAKAARAQAGGAVPWPTLLATGGAALRGLGKADVRLSYGGVERDAKRVVPYAGFATALAWSLSTRDGGKGVRRFSALLQETAKRGSAPDLDRAMGTRPGTVLREADEAVEGWPAR